jgi:hypothetical protein
MALAQAHAKWAQRRDSIYLTIELADVKDPELRLTSERLEFR